MVGRYSRRKIIKERGERRKVKSERIFGREKDFCEKRSIIKYLKRGIKIIMEAMNGRFNKFR